jgi:hypothetical protein
MSVTPESIRGLDEFVRTDLQEFRNSYFNWLLISTGVVILGVLLEGPELVWEVRELFLQRRLAKNIGLATRIPERQIPAWIILISLTGWLLVSLGVAGEGIFEGFASEADGLLQTFNNTLLSDTSGRASRAEVIAKAFETQIAEAKRNAETAKAQAAASDLARAQLEAIVSPRSISLQKQRLIKESLRRFSGHPAVVVSSYGLDGEGWALGAQIMSIIGSATGIAPIDRRAGSISTGGFESGVQIRGPSSEQAFMSALSEALSSIGELKEVSVNGASFSPGSSMFGPSTMAGPSTMVGPGRPMPPYVPIAGPISIVVGVKPLPVLTAK